ncbi:hypothetical protein ACVWW2_006643 [Bradyrhizobium sp. LM4.3]
MTGADAVCCFFACCWGLLGAGRSPRIGVGHGAMGFRTGGQAGGCGKRERAIEFGDQRAARVAAESGD